METDRDRLKAKVHELVASLGPDNSPFADDDNFREALGLDSLDGVELIMLIELEWGVDLSDDEASKIFTVDGIVAFLDQQGVK